MIPVKNGCPDFSHYAHGSVNITGGFGVNRNANFKEFDRSLAEQWSEGVPKKYESWFSDRGIDTDFLTSSDIEKFRKSNNLVWHEHQNGTTAQLLDSSLHTARCGGIPHMGGISEIKAKQAQKEYNLINNQEKK